MKYEQINTSKGILQIFIDESLTTKSRLIYSKGTLKKWELAKYLKMSYEEKVRTILGPNFFTVSLIPLLYCLYFV